MLLKLCSLPRSSFGFAASDAAGIRNAKMYSQLCNAMEFTFRTFQLFLRVGKAPGTGLVVRHVGIDSNGSAAGAFEDRTLNLELGILLDL